MIIKSNNQMLSQPSDTLSVILVGMPQSGKSSLVRGYSEVYTPSLIPQLTTRTLEINQRAVQFRVWDIPTCSLKQPQYQQACKEGQVAALFFDLSNQMSFEDSGQLFEEMLSEGKFRYDAKVCLIGSKSDIELEGSMAKIEEAGYIMSAGQTMPEQLKNVFKISTKSDKDTLSKLCESFYRVHKQPTIKTITDMQSLRTSPECAPVQSAAFTISPTNSTPANVQPTIVKLVLTGNSRVGKTALTIQYSDQTFTQQYIMTIGVDFRMRTIDYHNSPVKMQVWDTAGVQKFRTITSAYLKGGNRVYMVVFSCTDRSSFLDLPKHVQAIESHSNLGENNVKYIICNKIDSPEREVAHQEGSEYAKQVGYGYMEVSARDQHGVAAMFEGLAMEWLGGLGAQPM